MVEQLPVDRDLSPTGTVPTESRSGYGQIPWVLRPHVLLPLLHLGATLYYRKAELLEGAITVSDWVLLLASAAASAGFFYVAVNLCPRQRSIECLAVALAAAGLTTIHLVQFGYFQVFRSLITSSVIDFARQHPSYSLALVREQTTITKTVGAGVFFLVIAAYLAWSIFHRPEKRSRLRILSGALLIVVVSMFARNPNATLEQCFLQAGVGSLLGDGKLNAHFEPERISLPRQTVDAPINVVVFRLEAVTRQAVQLYNPEVPTMPFWTDFVETHPQEVFVARHHLTNSSATDVAVMLLYSGVAPNAPQDVHQSAPLLWSYAKSADYNTSAFLPFALTWGAFSERFQERPGEMHLDYIFNANNASTPLVYDHSVNDSDLLSAALHYQRKRAWAEPFLQIVSLKMPHFLGDGARVNGFQFLDDQLTPAQMKLRHYYNAIYHNDQIMHQFLENMPAAVRDNTAFVVVSDHGANVFEDRPPRLENYFHECAEVPFWIYLPLPVQARLQEGALDALKKNCNSIATCHMDFLPTVVDLMGLGRFPEVRDQIAQLPGQSMLRPMRPPESILMINTNALRRWNREGFSITLDNGTFRYVFNLGKEYFFDLQQDPQESFNLIAQPEVRKHLQRIDKIILDDPLVLQRISNLYGKTTPRSPEN